MMLRACLLGALALPAILALSESASAAPKTIAARRETAPVAQGAAANDAAIWLASPAEASLVIGADNAGGLFVYDLQGNVVQSVPGGQPDNIGLRDGFRWRLGSGPIVGASDRSDNALVFWRLDPAARRLSPTPAARIPTGFPKLQTFCLGRIEADFVVIAADQGGTVGVWRIRPDPDSPGGIWAEPVAFYSTGAAPGGCVVDDERGVYYLADEKHGVWETPIANADGSERKLVDRVGRGGHLGADVAGLALWRGANGKGFLVASTRSQSEFDVYDQAPPHRYRGSFKIGPSRDGAVDGASGTGGIDILSTPLPGLPLGLLVAQDTENTNPPAPQDFKYVSFADVVAALGL
jgi:3-phytase